MKFIPKAVTTKVARSILVSQKHSPQMLFAAGVVSMGASIALACRGTLQVESILDKHEHDLGKINSVLAKADPSYTEKDAAKDRMILQVRTAGEFSRVFAPAAVCALVSIGSFAGAQRILSKRNAALTAAYATVDKAFKDYRARVRQELGEEREKDIYYDLEPCEIDDPDGGKKIKTKQLRNGLSMYARFYDEYNKNYSPESTYNIVQLKGWQNYANDQLQARGHVLLNDIYDALGFDRTSAGAVVGWVKGEGDDYIDFGIFGERADVRVADFLSGFEKGIWLDFNVQGTVYDKIG